MAEDEVYQVLDDALRARSAPAGSARTLRQIERRLGRLEAAAAATDAEPPGPDPFDLDAASAVGRPVAPEAIGARTPDPAGDPFADDRRPIETPRLDALPGTR